MGVDPSPWGQFDGSQKRPRPSSQNAARKRLPNALHYILYKISVLLDHTPPQKKHYSGTHLQCRPPSRKPHSIGDEAHDNHSCRCL